MKRAVAFVIGLSVTFMGIALAGYVDNPSTTTGGSVVETDTIATVTARGRNLPPAQSITNAFMDIGADYSYYSGTVFKFLRPSQTNMNELRWYKNDDTNVPPNYFAMGPDYALNTNFFAMAFVNKLNLDLMTVGTDDDILGRFGVGATIPESNSQVLVVDVDTNITRSINIGANRTGVRVVAHLNGGGGVGFPVDGFELARNSENTANWAQWSQGDGAADWRIGMVSGSYDFVFYNANGGASAPSAPGTEYMRINRTAQTVEGVAAHFGTLKATNAIATVRMDGATHATVWMKDTAAGANVKQMLMRCDDGKTTFRALNDADDAYTFDIMVFDLSNGRVGVGTLSPEAMLDVNGGAIIRGATTNTGSITAGGGFYGNGAGLTNLLVSTLTEDPSGFAGETDNNRTYSFDPTQRVLTVTGASSVYRDGNLLTNFTTCSWPAIGTNSGIWYHYWGHAGGTQIVSQTSWALDDIQCATVWWQGGTATVSTAPLAIIGEETHGFMPWSVHRRFHLVEGSVYASGLDLNVGPKSFTNSSGIWMDEDIQHSVVPTNTCRILARSGITAIREQYCLTNGAGGADLMYDLNGTNTIVPTTGGGQYVNYWQYVVPGSVSDYMWVAGRTAAASTNSISTEAPYDLSAIMPFSEAVLLYRVTLRNSNPPTVAFTTDYRKSKVTGSSFAPSVHATLSGRDAPDSHPLSAITSYETLATTQAVSFAAAPACYQITLTNDSPLSFTNNWNPTSAVSRVTALGTGTVTFVMNWPSSQVAYWGFCYDATGRPSTVFPAGAIYFTNGVYSSTAPSLGVSNFVSVMHSCAAYQIMAFTNSLGTWGTP